MSPKKNLLVASFSFLALALGAAWYAWRLEQGAREALAAMAQKRSAIESKIPSAQDQLVANQRHQAEVQAQMKSLEASKSAAVKPAPARPAAFSLPAILTSNPKLLASYLKSFRLSLRQRFTPTYQKLGLTPEQIDKFEELATAHEGENMDLQASAESQGLSASDPGVVSMRQQSKEQFIAAASAAIGQPWSPEPGAVLNRLDPLQGYVNTVAQEVAYDSQPMTSAQAAQLTQILANTSPTYLKGGNAVPRSVNLADATAQAASVLTPAQVQAMTMLSNLNTIGALVNQFNTSRASPPQ